MDIGFNLEDLQERRMIGMDCEGESGESMLSVSLEEND